MLMDNNLMLPEHVRHVINDLASDPSVREVWLIGSQVNGSASTASDWDLVVRSTREPEATSRRHTDIDIIWSGPSGKTLAEGQSDFYAFPFDDFQWVEKEEDGIAQYVGRKFVEIDFGALHDTSRPIQYRPIQNAVRVWRAQSTTIRAVEMARTIRDAIYEETKDLSREELKAFFAREAAAMRQEIQDGGGRVQPPHEQDARAHR